MTIKELVEYLKEFPHQDATIVLASDEEGNSYFNLDTEFTLHEQDKEFLVIFYPCYPEVEIYNWGNK